LKKGKKPRQKMERMAKRAKKGVKKGAKKSYCEQPYCLRLGMGIGL
jgi:hypothetical protein